MHRILVIDDEVNVREVLARFLTRCGYDVSIADSGATAIALAHIEPFSLVVCDIAMPGMNGIETLRRLKEVDADLAVLMLTGVNDARLAVEAVSLGAIDYLVKPMPLAELQAAVERALHRHRLLCEQRRIERLIREEVAERTQDLEKNHATLRALTVRMAESLVTAMEMKDVHLRGHSQRVAALAAAVGEHMRLPAHEVEQLRLAGRLHDVGSIGVREAVLNKAGPLTAEEIAHVNEHVRIGVEILSPLSHLALAVSFVQDHHEHWDGGGYPRGLRGEDIAIGGRILAACDTFDALTSTRPYQPRMATHDALPYLRGLAGTVLDPRAVAALEAVVSSQCTITFLDVIDDRAGVPPASTRPSRLSAAMSHAPGHPPMGRHTATR